jgi:RHS repeat-associated protein
MGYLDGPFGALWQYSLDVRAVRVETFDHENRVIIRFPTGEVARFQEVAYGNYDCLAACSSVRSLVQDQAGHLQLTFLNGEVWDFDGSDRIQSQTTREGLVYHFRYNSLGQLAEYEEPDGKLWFFTYNDQHKVSLVSDGSLQWSFDYDARCNLLSADYPDGGHVGYSYQSDKGPNLLTSITNRRGQPLATYTYDDFSRVVQYTSQGHSYTRAFGHMFTTESPSDQPQAVTKRWYDSCGHSTGVEYPDGKVEESRYGFDGQLHYSLVGDASGKVVSETLFGNDPARNTTGVLDPLGGLTQKAFDSEDKLVATTDPAGNTTSHAYDGAGNLVVTTDPVGHSTEFTYSTSNVMTAVLDPNGNAITRTVDALARVVSETRMLGQTEVSVAFQYDDEGNRVAVTNANGATTEYAHDALGRVVAVLQPEVSVGLGEQTTRPLLTFEHDHDGNQVARIDPLGQTITATFDAFGNKTSESDPLGNVTLYSYSQGRLLSTTDPLGRVTRYEYDSADKLLRVIDAANGQTSYLYDTVGRRTHVTDSRGQTTITSYDAAGHVIAVTAPDSSVTRFEYDTVGGASANLIAVIDALNNRTEFAYDPNGRQVQKTDPNGDVTRFEYDPVGNRTAVLRAYGTQAQVRDEYSYDPLNRLSSITRAKGTTSEVTVRYGYDPNGNVIDVENGRGKHWLFSYDATNRLTSETDPLARTRTYKYDAAGHVIEKNDPKGQRIEYDYDLAGRMVEARYYRADESLENTVRCNYDAVGNMTRVTDSAVDIEQEFDALNRITSINHHHLNQVVRQEWDAAGNRTRLSIDALPNSTATYTWDSRNRLTAIHHATMGDVAYEYNANGQKTSVTLPNGIVCSYSYDQNGRLIELDYRKPNNDQLFLEQLTYDPRGNITQRVDTEGTHSYQYDWLDQLTRADYPGGANETFTYDPSGNRTSLTTPGGTTDYFVDDADQLTATAGPGTTEAVVFLWSPNGELESQLASGQTTPTSYFWDTRSMLLAVSLPSGQVLTYTYLPEQWLGWRLTAPTTAGVEHFLWDQVSGNTLADLDEGGSFRRTFLDGPGYDQHAASYTVATSAVHTYLADHLGSVVKLTRPDLTDAATYTYAAFGSPRSWNDGGTGNTFAFTGREYIPALGLQYNRARWMIPTAGVFLSADPAVRPGVVSYADINGGGVVSLSTERDSDDSVGEQSLYEYASNSPITLHDPTGRNPALVGYALRVALMATVAAAMHSCLDSTITPTGCYISNIFQYDNDLYCIWAKLIPKSGGSQERTLTHCRRLMRSAIMTDTLVRATLWGLLVGDDFSCSMPVRDASIGAGGAPVIIYRREGVSPPPGFEQKQ